MISKSDLLITNLLGTGILKIYVVSTFFSLLIFFTININLFTLPEIIIYTILGTVVSKSIAGIMFSLILTLRTK